MTRGKLYIYIYIRQQGKTFEIVKANAK